MKELFGRLKPALGAIALGYLIAFGGYFGLKAALMIDRVLQQDTVLILVTTLEGKSD